MIPHNRTLLPSGRTPQRERGVTLVIALIFLVMLTLIAVTAAQNSGQEERMAGNTRQRDLAFQAADATLAYMPLPGLGLTYSHLSALIASSGTSSTAAAGASLACPLVGASPFGSAQGFLAWDPARDNDAAYWSSYDWAAQSLPTTTFGLGLNQVGANLPRYVVEQLPNAVNPGPPAVTSCFYRVTVRAQGADANAVVILQAIYKFTS
ncbi:MAG: PilX N-terminal domain-containing pilus assembly protein [Sulfuricella sp.]